MNIFGNPSTFMLEANKYNYPNPFLDLYNHYIPTNIKELFKWYEYVMFSNPVVSGAIKNFVSYPITDIVIEGGDEDTIKDYLKEIDWRSLFIEIGLNKFVYGNAFLIMFSPFNRLFTCTKCKNEFSDQIVNYRVVKDGSFSAKCPKCGYTGVVRYKEIPNKRDINKLTFKIWNPKLMGLKEHPFSGKREFYSDIPKKLKRAVLEGNDTFYLNDTPAVIIRAVKQDKQIKFKEGTVYHLKNNSLAGKESEWGMSPLMPLLKNLFYIQTLRKANESIALEHMVPLRMVFPQIDANTANFVNLAAWGNAFQNAVRNWRVDQNNVFISNVPIGVQYMGGQYKMLEVSKYIEDLTKEVIAGLGIPYEFVFGGLTWSATSITLRMLENQFSTFIGELKDVLEWMVKNICKIFNLKKPNKVDFVKFKMVDDIQQKQFLAELAANNKISTKTLLTSLGLDYDKEMQELEEDLEVQTKLAYVQQMAAQSIAAAQMQQQTYTQGQNVQDSSPQGEPQSPSQEMNYEGMREQVKPPRSEG